MSEDFRYLVERQLCEYAFKSYKHDKHHSGSFEGFCGTIRAVIVDGDGTLQQLVCIEHILRNTNKVFNFYGKEMESYFIYFFTEKRWKLYMGG